MPPLRGAEVAVNGATGDSANRKWCDSIVVVYDQLLAGKYPFVRGKGARDAHVDDVQKFFQPKTGTLWQYFTESLQGDIDHPAGTTVFHVEDQPSVKYKPGLMVFLKRAQEITDLLYAKDPSKLGLTAQVRIRPSAPYNKIVFESGGKKITYFNAKERWDDVAWPGRGALFHFYYPKGGRGRARLHRRRVGAVAPAGGRQARDVVGGRGVPGGLVDAAARRRRDPRRREAGGAAAGVPRRRDAAVGGQRRGVRAMSAGIGGAMGGGAGGGRRRRWRSGSTARSAASPTSCAPTPASSRRLASIAGSRTRWRSSAPRRPRCRPGRPRSC